GAGQEGALRQPRVYARYRRHPARRERRHAGLSLPACGKPAVSVPFPLDRERHRVLGQPLRPAPRDVGLLATCKVRHARDGEGGAAGVSRDCVDASQRLRQSPAKAKQDFGGRPCSAQKTTNSSPKAVRAPAWVNCFGGSGFRCCFPKNCLTPTARRSRLSSWARSCSPSATPAVWSALSINIARIAAPISGLGATRNVASAASITAGSSTPTGAASTCRRPIPISTPR